MATKLRNKSGRSIDPDYSAELVPELARISKGSLTMAWWALCSAMFYLVVSATLALTYGALNAIVGMAAACLAFTLLARIVSRFAISTGSSVGLFSQLLFGRSAGHVATAILFFSAVYYAVFEGSVIAVAMSHYFASLPLWMSYLIVVVYSVPLVFGSISSWMDRLNGYLLPFYIAGLVASVIIAIDRYGYSHDWLVMGDRGESLDGRWWHCFTSYMGVWVIIMYTWDYARFGRASDQKFLSEITFGAPFYYLSFFLNGVIGIFLVSTIEVAGDVSETTVVISLVQLMGIWGLLFIWVSQTRINSANFQMATVTLQNILGSVFSLRPSKVLCAIVAGIGIFLFMLTDVFSFILAALAYQGIFIVSWIVLALLKIRELTPMLQQGGSADSVFDVANCPAVNWTGVTVWVGASVVGLVVLLWGEQFATSAAPITAVATFIFVFLAKRVGNGSR